MGSTNDFMMCVQEERFTAWAAEHYPDVSPDTPAWEQIGNYFYWEQDALEVQHYEETLEIWFQEKLRASFSLDNIEQRFWHAMRELVDLEQLNNVPQPELVCRMGIVHSVSVMDAFLMYCARALLNHDWPLRRFRDNYFLPFASAKEIKAASTDNLSLFRDSARRYVARKSFQSEDFIKRYFSTVLHFPCDWQLFNLGWLSEFRNDLVHRGGYTKTGSRRDVSSADLSRAISVVEAIIETAMASLRLEEEFFRNGLHDEEKAFVCSVISIETSAGSQP